MTETAVTETYPDLVPTEDCPGWLREVPLAHRGLHEPGGAAENSLPAFAAAAAAGYGVELDVMLSRDGVPVASHDPTLQRAAGRSEKVAELTVAELATVRLAGTRAHVPTLAAALAELRSVPVMVELKQPSLRVGGLEAAVARLLDVHPGPWCVASFNPASLRWFRRNRPEAVRALTAGPVNGARLPRVVRRRIAEEARDDTPEAMDRVWEEEAVRFGAEAPPADCGPQRRPVVATPANESREMR